MKFNASAWIRVPAERFPDRTCIHYRDRRFTYAEINARANRLAWGLIQRGFTRGSRVACLQYNCNQSFELFLAMWKAGIVMVPLNTRDSALQNIDILNDCAASALIFGVEFIDQIGPIRRALPDMKQFICHGDPQGRFIEYESILAGSDPSEPDFEFDENEIYKIHYTSGTTGKPRGVIMTYRNRKEQIAHVFMNADRLISKEDVFLHVAPLTHAAGYYSTPYYLKGARHVILDKFDPGILLETIQKEKVSCTLLVPTMIVMLLEQDNIRNYDLSSLKRIFYGTAPMPTSKLKQAVSIFGNVFRQNYGLTEAVQPLAHLTPEEHIMEGEGYVVDRLRSAGTRALGVEVRIVDDNDEDLPAGQIGEILLRSPHISPGYLNLPGATAETYKDGWLHTGDLGYRDAGGYLFIVDRKKDMIISGGFNIYSREVEIFLDSHPAVLESAVIGAPDEKWGEAVKAFIVVKKDKIPPQGQELVEFCLQKGLSRYKVPKLITFIDRLPKNENGKIIKKNLKMLS
ncbi:MAG: long-chain fatty acid--CoA ligase [Desulfobacterales bacterium]|jgi:long-chain acyl-CoA synthetase